MDYQLFLLSRIKERYDQSGSTADAVADGVGSTARLITGAALIIVAVFLGFAMGDLVMFQQMGFGVAVALLIDATIIRSVLLPAAMTILGDWNWYLPRWLEWLPKIEVEDRSRAATGPWRAPASSPPWRELLERVLSRFRQIATSRGSPMRASRWLGTPLFGDLEERIKLERTKAVEHSPCASQISRAHVTGSTVCRPWVSGARERK